ncbi:serine hydrolase domain-containing protein [Aureibaculum luteum]|uniref:serine hydrolase domain-containing protein n=1 Tax=Aureibaculum luteum TaxID=1548456 RepID=UPI000E4F0D65|nr:serine hydrolase [Aureibaculum luteum]
MKPILHSRILIFCVLLSVFSVSAQDKLTYANPSDVGLDSTYINHNVDSIMTLGIENHAFPGAQVLVAKDSKIIFHKAYGFQTYDSVQQVGLNDIYDLASVTKITAALPAIMKLVDEGKLDLDKPFSDYWKRWKHVKNKKDLTLREILAHQAGLQPYIVFLSEVFKKNGEIKKRFVKRKSKRGYTNQAYNGLYIKNRFNRKMYRIANRSKVSSIKKYKYSGLTFLMYPELVKQMTGKPFDTYLQETFYKPLGATTMGFLPKTKNFTNTIIPTEVDSLFRKELTRGWVHDENAALLGGISGNAGLFATATDLAKIMQMYQNYGVYDGKRYFSEATVKEFTKIQYPDNENRRGLGFDKPSIGNDTLTLKDAYPAPEVSAESFGHSGFTGTFIWADPKEKLVYIFLSNRVNPTRKSRGIYTFNIRSAIQEVFYKAKKE